MGTEREYKFMKDAVELLGGEALDKLGERGYSPREVALILVGGPEKAARLFGLESRQAIYKRKGRWPVEWYLALEEVTGIPPKYLTLSAKEYLAFVEGERKKLEDRRKKLEKSEGKQSRE